MAPSRAAAVDNEERGVAHRVLELFGIIASAASIVVLLRRCFEGIPVVAHEGGDAVATRVVGFVVALASGPLLADFCSGVAHFTLDRFFTSDTPFIGRNFVRPFRQHHKDPKQMTRHGFMETNGNNCLATCVPLFTLLAIPVDYHSAWQLVVVTLVVSGAAGLVMTNQIHKWAHDDDPPRAVLWLQDHGVILPRRHHQVHHTWPYDGHYCITTGWTNGLLRRVRFWRGLEWFYTRVLRMRLYTEATPWEQVPGSPAFNEHEHMATTSGR